MREVLLHLRYRRRARSRTRPCPTFVPVLAVLEYITFSKRQWRPHARSYPQHRPRAAEWDAKAEDKRLGFPQMRW